MKVNPQNLVIVRECDWKEELEQDDMQMLKEHAEEIGGEVVELRVYNSDSRVFYSGPAGIEDWMNDRCAFDVFSDATLIINDDGETMMETEEIYFYPDQNQLCFTIKDHVKKNKRFVNFKRLEQLMEEYRTLTL